jgi:YggT family protein
MRVVFRLTLIILRAIFTIIEGSLLMGFLLRLLGANPNNSFVAWFYNNTDSLLDPFRGIFPTRVFDGQYVIEFNTLFAIIIYLLLYLLLEALVYQLVRIARDRDLDVIDE